MLNSLKYASSIVDYHLLITTFDPHIYEHSGNAIEYYCSYRNYKKGQNDCSSFVGYSADSNANTMSMNECKRWNELELCVQWIIKAEDDSERIWCDFVYIEF